MTMLPRVLFISTISATSTFNRPFMRWFRTQGWRVDYVSGDEQAIADCDNHYTIPMSRSPCSMVNVTAVNKLANLLEREQYAIVHCHTPVASVVARLAARRLRKEGLKVLYTAHGFHFYTGAPPLNWLVYYPLEKCLSRITDGIITINEEDYDRALGKFGGNCAIYNIDGVGVDLQRFTPASDARKADLRESMGYGRDDFVMVYVAELNRNKNHILLLRQIDKIKQVIPGVKIVFVGRCDYPPVLNYIRNHALASCVTCVGYKTNVEDYYAVSDVCVSTSMREGLPVNVIEGMATGLPVVASVNRGHRSLVAQGRNGFLFDSRRPERMVEYLFMLYSDKSLRAEIARNNILDVKKYSVDIAVNKMADIYREYMN